MIYMGYISMDGSIESLPAVAAQSSDLARLEMETNSGPRTLKGNDNIKTIEDQESVELFSQVRSKENEILNLREQIALASMKESQLLNEKHLLEQKFSELRVALDEKQNEAITSAANELARRKGDLEENLRLVNELKIAEDERYIFMSSLLGLLAEYGVWPRITNASALTNSIKHLHDQLQMKIKNLHDRTEEINAMAGNQAGNEYHGTENHGPGQIVQLPNSSLGGSVSKRYGNGQYAVSADLPRYIRGNDGQQTGSLMLDRETYQSPDTFKHPKPASNNDKGSAASEVNNIFDRSGLKMRSDEMVNDQLYHSHQSNDRSDSLTSEGEGPGIENFQIIGEAKPGGKLLGCGFCVRGTSLCMFQWVRHYADGTRQYIEGATNPEYIVTADDVDKVIAVECIPMDDNGRQGDLVRLFANDQNKITCDPDMQLEINTHISNGQATFNVLMLLDSPENWETTILFVRRSSFQVKVHRTQDLVIEEKFSMDLAIKVPNGLSSQFVLTCADGSSYFFSTNDDVRMRDTLVLTMRIFQSKALDEKRKGKA